MAIANGTDKGAASANNSGSDVLDFTLMGPLYRFTENASYYDIKDQLDLRLSQLEAMLSILADVPPFVQHNDVRIGHYFTACETTARECKELSQALNLREDDIRQEASHG